MEESEIPVTKQKILTTHIQTITPESRDSVIPLLSKLLEICRSGKIHGTIQINLSQGGVRTLVTETYEERVVS